MVREMATSVWGDDSSPVALAQRFSFNKAVFKPFMYKFSDHLSAKGKSRPAATLWITSMGGVTSEH